MSALADDGFGNLISTAPQPEGVTWVFAKLNGRLARWRVGTPDHRVAIDALRAELRHDIKPVLALIESGSSFRSPASRC